MQRIGPYTVLDELGRGGNGVVYSARDPAGRTVALKVLGRGRSPKKIQRFEREVEALAGFSHPHVVRVHTAGHTDQLVYFAMDLATGGSLGDRLSAGGRFSAERAVRLGIDLADGMAAAHARGVLHRDLKPDNVLFNDAGEVLISDFGLARQLLDSEDLTQEGHMLGSPGYMAPEQVLGDRSAQGERTDVYGLGATLYFALTGHAPFEGESLAYYVQATVEDRPEPPSLHNALIPPALDQIVLRCLEKAPEDRPPSMVALTAALEGFLAGEVEAGRRGLLAVAMLAALLALAATAGLLWVWFHDSPPAPVRHPAVTHGPKPELPPAPSDGAQEPEPPPLRLGWQAARAQGRAFMKDYDFDQAVRHFNHARSKAPEEVWMRLEKERLEAYEKRMRLRWASGDVKGAELDCDVILEASAPVVASVRGDTQPVFDGISDLAYGAELQVSNARAREMRMHLKRLKGDLRGALQESRLCMEIQHEPRVTHEQAWLLYALQELDGVEVRLKRCCEARQRPYDQRTHDPRGYLLLATLARERGEEERAQRLLEFAGSSLKPLGPHEAAHLKDPDLRPRLRRELAALVASPQDDPAYWAERGRLAWRCAEPAAAEEAFRQALDRDPEHVGALEGWFDLCHTEGQWARAAELARRLGRLEGRRLDGLCRVARAYRHGTRYDLAAEAAGDAIDLEPSLRQTAYGAIYARGLVYEGRFGDALRLLGPLLRSDDERLAVEASLALRFVRAAGERNGLKPEQLLLPPGR